MNAIIDRNMAIYLRETKRALEILCRNRHSTKAPYKWFGPSAEPQSAGDNCECAGCRARFGKG